MVVAPAVVSPRPARLKRAAKVRKGETGHAIGDSQFDRRRIESEQRFRDLPQQVPVLPALRAVSVESTERAKEDLPTDPGRGVKLDDLSDLQKLVSKAGPG